MTRRAPENQAGSESSRRSSGRGSAAAPETIVTSQPGDPRLADPDTLEEIDLYSELMIHASRRDGRLSTQEIDKILGLTSESHQADESRQQRDRRPDRRSS